MINLYIEPYCEDCGDFEADIERIDVSTIGDVAVRNRRVYMTNVYCEHRSKCAAMAKRWIDLPANAKEEQPHA